MAIIQNKKTLNLQDIQGMVTIGYSELPYTAYLILHISNGIKAKKWIAKNINLIDTANHLEKKSRTIHLAFGKYGLQALGLHSDNFQGFPFPFLEGISTPNRSRILGDYGINHSDNWRFGAHNDEHVLMVLHAESAEDIKAFINELKEEFSGDKSFVVNFESIGFNQPDNKEHFGFHDGISQPVVKGSGKSGPENDIIETGEFILGYKNEHQQYPDSPKIYHPQGNMDLLHDDPKGSGLKDLGVNGTFLVYRQMEQHVEKFWNFMEEQTKNSDGSINEDEKIKLAAKCVGRWPSGASLVNYPDSDPGGDMINDDFGYADKDPDGLRCPFGSHLRRNNPRDAHRNYSKQQSLKITKQHRIMRRGRIYDENGEKGLHFLCFNTNIELQFEFIQHLWSNNNQMFELTNDVDVLIGVPQENNPHNNKRKFTIQSEPTNKYIQTIDQFTSIKGGAYFFFPSISALKYLTTL